MENSVIRIENAEFSYPKGPAILKIGHLEVKKGEKVFVFGPSGSGKSTLLSLLTGINTPVKGKVRYLEMTWLISAVEKEISFVEATVVIFSRCLI